MINANQLVRKAEEIAARNPSYRTGGTGRDGTCDCIGLVMGAMYELGHKIYDLHSTNYFARYQTEDMAWLGDVGVQPGELLFKTRDAEEGLHARYKPGGGYYNGDLLDYYHVGVVTSAAPLRIAECTQTGSSSGIRISHSLAGWQTVARITGVEYGEQEDSTDISTQYRAVVATQSGALNLRDAPGGNRIGQLDKGSIVTVEAEQDGWAFVSGKTLCGYVCSRYLERAEEEQIPPWTSLADENGRVIMLAGKWHIVTD